MWDNDFPGVWVVVGLLFGVLFFWVFFGWFFLGGGWGVVVLINDSAFYLTFSKKSILLRWIRDVHKLAV